MLFYIFLFSSHFTVMFNYMPTVPLNLFQTLFSGCKDSVIHKLKTGMQMEAVDSQDGNFWKW